MLVPVSAPLAAIRVAVKPIVIAMRVLAIATTVIETSGSFPTVYVKKLMPGEVPVSTQPRPLVPLAKRFVSFQPERHMLGAPRLNSIMSRRLVRITYLFVGCSLGRIQKQQAAGY